MLCVLTVLPILRVWPPTRLYLLPLILDYPHLLLVPVVGSFNAWHETDRGARVTARGVHTRELRGRHQYISIYMFPGLLSVISLFDPFSLPLFSLFASR